jgi:SAM-dependent methyltransferase
MRVDWNLGRYEVIAEGLEPAAAETVRIAAPKPGERLLDVGCGTGNAALLAAAAGGDVTGIDPAERLLDLARRRAQEAGVEIGFEVGEAAALPVPDGGIDVVISVFGVIFAPDERAAAAELARVLSPSGRIALSAWKPEGPIAEAARARAQAVDEPAEPPPPRFAWHEQPALEELFGPHGFTVSVEECELAFRASSPEAFVEMEMCEHPAGVSAAESLDPGRLQEIGARVLEVFRARNEDPSAFQVRSPYVVATLRRRPGGLA